MSALQNIETSLEMVHKSEAALGLTRDAEPRQRFTTANSVSAFPFQS
jgi:hypothetical protein